MIYTGIIAALSSLDLGIKWLIEREKPEDFPKPLRHTCGKILVYRNQNAGFPFGFLEKHGEGVRMLPLAVISGLFGFLTALLPQKGKRVQKIGIAIILGGAISNLYDRLVRRYVVDYFSIQCGKLKEVVFNLGDIFVFLGSGILFTAEVIKEIRGVFPKETSLLSEQRANSIKSLVDSGQETM